MCLLRRPEMWVVLSVLGCSDGDSGDTADGDTNDTDLPWIEDTIPQTTLEKVDIAWLVDTEWTEGIDALKDVLIDGDEVLLLADTDWTQGTINVSSPSAGPNFGIFARRWSCLLYTS